ncbi:transposable element Tcb2 transposase [Trichonephila clavipes]|nr:transposable element Tcb2 transposase [Trichonephila clavipes]
MAEEFGINKIVIWRTWEVIQTIGTDDSKVGDALGERLQWMTDILSCRQKKRDRYQLASTITQQLCIATGREVSRLTVARHLSEGGLFTRRPECFLLLKVGHQWDRLEWCNEHKNWISHQWSESRFGAKSDSQRHLI